MDSIISSLPEVLKGLSTALSVVAGVLTVGAALLGALMSAWSTRSKKIEELPQAERQKIIEGTVEQDQQLVRDSRLLEVYVSLSRQEAIEKWSRWVTAANHRRDGVDKTKDGNRGQLRITFGGV